MGTSATRSRPGAELDGKVTVVTGGGGVIRARGGWRRILVTSSSSVLAPGVRMAAYQTSKFAVTAFGETLREELAPEGIGVTVLFPHGMITRHLESSADARPGHLGTTGAAADDLTAMLAHRPMGGQDVASPEHAVRNLWRDLVDDAPYSVTHGAFRPAYEHRRDAMDAAFDRMEGS